MHVRKITLFDRKIGQNILHRKQRSHNANFHHVHKKCGAFRVCKKCNDISSCLNTAKLAIFRNKIPFCPGRAFLEKFFVGVFLQFWEEKPTQNDRTCSCGILEFV